MLYLKTFCIFWNTRQGCIVIGYLSGGLSVACCVGSILRLFMGLPEILLNDDYQGEFPFNPLFFVFSSVFFAFHVIASFSLIPAVKEGQGMFIVPTVVMLLIDIVLDCIALIVMGMKLGKPNDLETLLTTGVIVSSTLIPLLIYSVLIVISHFEEMFQQTDRVPLQKSTSLRRQKETTPTGSADNSDTSFGTII
ncbi:uncharacterized protein NPIL_74141 [Nephila pilipes]|uniref:Uncharacterized protein n=1 Tax=Nephila pilipes TaxID=299642 RepID=A0A8X6PSR8_NEPPI|nr:uncharacterized protein NPIL_74141 [Nephila pilipes]